MSAAHALLFCVALLSVCGPLLATVTHHDRSVHYLLSSSASDAPPVIESVIQNVECGDGVRFRLRADGLVDYEGTVSDRQRLLKRGYDIVNEMYGEPFFRLRKQTRARLQGYHSPAELFTLFGNLARKNPSIAQFINLTSTLNAPTTHEGRSIFALKISANVSLPNTRQNVIIVSGHHARELITPEIALFTATQMIAEYGIQKDITEQVNAYNTYILWTLNPDGLEYVWSVDNMWRKNRKPNPDGTVGVDLNRNYPIGWAAECSGTDVPQAEDYRGTSAASESETQTMLLLHKQLGPYKMLDFHSFARQVRIPYANCMELPDQVNGALIDAAQQLAKSIGAGYAQTRSCCGGGNIHNAVNKHATLAMLVETGTSFQPNRKALEEELRLVWKGIRTWFGYRAGVEGFVTDTDNKTAIPTIISVENVVFHFDELNQATSDTGRFHIWMTSGSYNITFTAPGYATVRRTVTIGDFGKPSEPLLVTMNKI